MEIRLVLSQSENDNYNPNLARINQIQDRFLSVHKHTKDGRHFAWGVSYKKNTKERIQKKTSKKSTSTKKSTCIKKNECKK